MTPTVEFKPSGERARLKLSRLTGKVTGLRGALTQIFIVAAALEILALASPLFTQTVVDDVFTSGDRGLLSVLAAGFALVLIFQTTLAWTRSWMLMVLSQTISLQWTGNVFAHLVKLPVAFFERRQLGDVVSRFSSVTSIQRTLTSSVVEAILDGIMCFAALVAMFVYSPVLGGVSVAAALCYCLVRWSSYSLFREASAERLVLAAKESSHFLETLRAMTALKLFAREEERRAQWQNIVVDIQNRDVRTTRLSIGYATANTLIFGVENILTYWIGGGLVAQAQSSGTGAAFSVGMLFAFISYRTQFSSRISALVNYVVDLRMLDLHAERLGDIALQAPEASGPAGSKDLLSGSNDLEHLPPTIELRGVSFRYSEVEPWVLRDVDFKIEAGESVAITGPSGGGKSTLLKIMLGILQPSSGEILYGGVAVSQLGLANVRRQLGTVMQDDTLLSGSLLENICFFASTPDIPAIEDCAALAQIHETIQAMPMGYQTRVGDMGHGLSGGQKQRVLLARALYKAPRILALDEATSHLDVDAEREVTKAFARLQMTRIVIAHRAETIAGAQRVVQLREGRIQEVVKVVGRPVAAEA